uniref:Variant surface glycoprotein 1125.4244 n=1 Tax=Trypanosoma brucei TaxID=5691 RepID=A0A1J0RAA3_9TRYP|nr:variant surface glycoprotein 1125.4244 [Trypanosoma brucei]
MLFKVALTLVAATHGASAAFTAANRNDLLLLCSLANLRGRQVVKPDLETDFANDISELEKMNMSVADPVWQAIFTGNPETDNYEQKHKDATQEPFKTHWKENYDKWLSIKYSTTQGAGAAKWISKHPPPTGWAAKQAATKINLTLDALAGIVQQYSAAKTAATSSLPKEAQELISEAIYGQGATNNKFAAEKAVAAANNWGNSCGDNGGKSLIGDMMCICGNSNADRAQDCDDSNLNIKWSAGVDEDSAAAILAECPKAPDGPVTIDELTGALARVEANIRHINQGNNLVLYLGTATGGTCNGNTGQACVIYTKHFAKGSKKGVVDIPWGQKLAAARQKLDSIGKKQKTAEARAAEANQLIYDAKSAFSHPLTAPTPSATGAEADSKDAKQKDEEEKQKKLCEKIKDKEKCKEICKWTNEKEETGNHCGVDESKVNTQKNSDSREAELQEPKQQQRKAKGIIKGSANPRIVSVKEKSMKIQVLLSIINWL